MVRKKNTAENFEKKIFELVKNIVFGKSVENLKNRVSRSTSISQKIFGKNQVAAHKIKIVLMFNKPSLCVHVHIRIV